MKNFFILKDAEIPHVEEITHPNCFSFGVDRMRKILHPEEKFSILDEEIPHLIVWCGQDEENSPS